MAPENKVLRAHCLEQIHECLTRLRLETGAQCVLLIDVSGHLIDGSGNNGQLDFITLSSLAAGEMSAARELVRQIGARAHPRAVLHEGEHKSIYLSDVDGNIFLLAICDNNTPLGLLRLRVQEATSMLKGVLQKEYARSISEKHDWRSERTYGGLQRTADRRPERGVWSTNAFYAPQ